MKPKITLREYREIIPLEQLSNDEKVMYLEKGSLSWAQAVYILQGYKPPELDIEIPNAVYHFTDLTNKIFEHLESNVIGHKKEKAGLKNYYVDTPEKWVDYWEKYIQQQNKQTESPQLQSKLQNQHDAILEVISQKGINRMEIPAGKKRTIENNCCVNYPLFFDKPTSFDNAWRKGRGKIFKMAEHDSYAKRTNK
ncbi:hypothetical protein LBMAG43_18730 [Methylococcaceae bacterium]|nr:hypothetical protein LBMAG43_18730 [Methylococcaceae bacterium]